MDLSDFFKETLILDCWNRIGVFGDSTCKELKEHIHCRNCPVFSNAGRNLLQRAHPDNYLIEWQKSLSVSKTQEQVSFLSVIIFRVENEWFAFETIVLKEVAENNKIVKLPHSKNKSLTGIVNVRGEIQLCFSLKEFFELTDIPDKKGMKENPRILVADALGYKWVFPVNEVLSIVKIEKTNIKDVPVNLEKYNKNYLRGMFTHEDKSVGILDPDLLFNSLKRTVF